MAPGRNSIVIKIEGDGESAQKALEMVREQMQMTAERAKESGGEISEAMERVKTSLEYVGAYMGIREAIDSIKEITAGALEFGEQIEKASQKTGLAAGTLSTLHYAAAITGSDFDGLTSAVAKMDKTIGAATEGNKKAEAFMKSLGLNAQQLAGQSDGAEIAFKKFATTLAATENPIRRVELATAFLGKAGAEQIPMLIDLGEHWDEYTSRARAAGVYLDTEGAAALAKTNEQLHALEQNIQGSALAFSQGLTPALGQLIGVIGDGSGSFSFLATVGDVIARSMAGATTVVYGLYSGLAKVFEIEARISNFGGKDETSERFHDLAEEYDKQSRAAADIFINGAKKQTEEGSASPPKGVGAFGGVGDITGGKPKGDDALLRAAAALDEAIARQQASMLKSATGDVLAINDAKHKLLQLSDEQYYEQKLSLEKGALAAEVDAIDKQITTLQALEQKQHRENAKRGKDAKPEEERQTQERIVALTAQRADIESRSRRLDTANDLGTQERAQQVKLATAKIAAKLEEETNTTITARLALMKMENDLELQKIAMSAGKDSPEYRQQQALEGVMEAKLRIADVDRQIRESEAENTRAVKELSDAAEKDPRFKKEATAQINALNKAEAQSLSVLVDKYEQLAQQLGGPSLETAKNLRAELDKLNTPDQKDGAQFSKTLAEGVESIGNRVAESSLKGKNAFHDMAESIGEDALRLALKLAEEKWLTPVLEGMMGGSPGGSVPSVPMSMFETHADGGTMNGPSLVGERGPELWMPPAKGGSVATAETLTKLAETGGGGRGGNVTTNVINQSSQPVTAQPATVSYDSEFRSRVISIVLEDHANGGPTRALTGG